MVGVSRTTTMQSFILTAIATAEKYTFISRLDIKFQHSQWSMKFRSRAPSHGVCSKSVSSTVTMQCFILPSTCITATEKCTLFSRLNIKFWQSRWSMKYRSRAQSHSVWLFKCITDDYYARFHTHIYHCCREMHFICRLDAKLWKSRQSM